MTDTLNFLTGTGGGGKSRTIVGGAKDDGVRCAVPNTTMTDTLNSEQRAALVAVQRGRNIFLTGAGGTGKSHTIRAIVGWAKDAGLRCAVTAMTGCAALLLGLGAKTLHSWAGVGLAREAPHELAEAVKRNKRAARRWIDTQLLIIDEVSMMTPEFLEKLDLIARRIRKRPDTKFGGLQLVMAGDFCQLPPVVKGVSGEMVFVFETPTWRTVIDQTVELVQIQRQQDPVFQQLLNEARMGALTPESIKVLEERMGLDWQENDIRPTLLFTRNAEVDAINRRNMEALEGERRIYEAQTVLMDKTVKRTGSGLVATQLITPDDPDVQIALEKLDTDAPYDKTLELCIGAQVMLLVNLDQERGLVNGSRGIVTGYTLGGLPTVRFLSCRDPVIMDRANWWLGDFDGIGRAQIPLKIAYAITIHKSQGATLDSALVDIGSSTFEFGQAYVALSRVRTLFGLYVWKLDPRKIRAHPAVVAYYQELAAARTAPVQESADPTVDLSEDPAPAAPAIWTTDNLSPAWSAVVAPFLESPKGIRLAEQLRARQTTGALIQPAPEDVFAALRACPDPTAVRVVILGQDPYPTAGVPHGLAFSVRSSVTKLPASLQNMYKEMASDLGGRSAPTDGCLQRWADQGVLLLNDVLTVTVGAPQSHCGMGWEDLTAQLLATVLAAADHCVILAWGRHAQKKLEVQAVRALLTRHTVLTAPHPSPLSAHTGFFGSRPFSQTNAALASHGQAGIVW
jgi:ATP-dependent DNA helicase PIF1